MRPYVVLIDHEEIPYDDLNKINCWNIQIKTNPPYKCLNYKYSNSNLLHILLSVGIVEIDQSKYDPL